MLPHERALAQQADYERKQAEREQRLQQPTSSKFIKENHVIDMPAQQSTAALVTSVYPNLKDSALNTESKFQPQPNDTTKPKEPKPARRSTSSPAKSIAITIPSTPHSTNQSNESGGGTLPQPPTMMHRTRSAPTSNLPVRRPPPPQETPAHAPRSTWNKTLRNLGVDHDLDSDDEDIAKEELNKERYSKCKAYTGAAVKYATSTFVSVPTALNAAKSAVSASVDKITWDWLWNQSTFGQGSEVAYKFISSLSANLFVAADYGLLFIKDVFPKYAPSRLSTEPRMFLFDVLLLTTLGVTATSAQYEVNHEGWESIANDPAAHIYAILSAIPVFASRFLGPRRIAQKLFGLLDDDVTFTKELVDTLNRIGELHIVNINHQIEHAFIIEKLIKQGYYSEKSATKQPEPKESEQSQKTEQKPNRVSAFFSNTFKTLGEKVGWNTAKKSKDDPKKAEKPKVQITADEMKELQKLGFFEVSKTLYPSNDLTHQEESRCRAIQQVIVQGRKAYERSEFDDLVMERALRLIDTYIKDAPAHITHAMYTESVRNQKKKTFSQQDNKTTHTSEVNEPKSSEAPNRKKSKPRPVIRERAPNERRFDKQCLELDIVIAVCVGLCSNTVWLEKLNMGLPNAIRHITLDQVDGMVKEALASIMASPHTLLYANAALEFRELLTDTLKALVDDKSRLLEFLTLSNFNVWASYSLERIGKSAFSNPQRLLQTFGINPEVDSLFTRIKTWAAIKGTQLGAFFVNINSYLKTHKGKGLHGLSIYIRREKQCYGKALKEFEVKEVQVGKLPSAVKKPVAIPKYPHLFKRRPNTLGPQPTNVAIPVATPVMSHSVGDRQPLKLSSASQPHYGATGPSVRPADQPAPRLIGSPVKISKR